MLFCFLFFFCIVEMHMSHSLYVGPVCGSCTFLMFFFLFVALLLFLFSYSGFFHFNLFYIYIFRCLLIFSWGRDTRRAWNLVDGEKGRYGRSGGKENHNQNVLYFHSISFISFPVGKKLEKYSVVTTTYSITEHLYTVQAVATPSFLNWL